MTTSTRRTFSVRCALLRRHDWAVRSTEDGGRYAACRRCGRERTDWPVGGAEFGAL